MLFGKPLVIESLKTDILAFEIGCLDVVKSKAIQMAKK
jgi:hypothetical protein